MNFNKAERVFFHIAVTCVIAGVSIFLADYIEPKKAMIVGGAIMLYYILYFVLRFMKASNEARRKRLPGVPCAEYSSASNARNIDMRDSHNPNDMRSSLYLINRMD